MIPYRIMIDMAQDYNGWTNYETWNVKLWMDNNEGSCLYWQERTTEYRNEGANEERSAIVCSLADELKATHEDAMPELEPSVYSDLLNAALSDVNWYQIAESLVQGAEERAV